MSTSCLDNLPIFTNSSAASRFVLPCLRYFPTMVSPAYWIATTSAECDTNLNAKLYSLVPAITTVTPPCTRPDTWLGTRATDSFFQPLKNNLCAGNCVSHNTNTCNPCDSISSVIDHSFPLHPARCNPLLLLSPVRLLRSSPASLSPLCCLSHFIRMVGRDPRRTASSRINSPQVTLFPDFLISRCLAFSPRLLMP